MGRHKAGRSHATIMRLSEKGRKALEGLTDLASFNSMNIYMDRLFIKLWDKGTPIVKATSSPKEDQDES